MGRIREVEISLTGDRWACPSRDVFLEKDRVASQRTSKLSESRGHRVTRTGSRGCRAGEYTQKLEMGLDSWLWQPSLKLSEECPDRGLRTLKPCRCILQHTRLVVVMDISRGFFRPCGLASLCLPPRYMAGVCLLHSYAIHPTELLFRPKSSCTALTCCRLRTGSCSISNSDLWLRRLQIL